MRRPLSKYFKVTAKQFGGDFTYQNLHRCKQRKDLAKKVGFIFEKTLDFRSLLWYVARLTEKEAQPMKNTINELWHGNIIPQEDSRTNSKEMKELLGYMARHHEDLGKTFTEEQKEMFDKFHVTR